MWRALSCVRSRGGGGDEQSSTVGESLAAAPGEPVDASGVLEHPSAEGREPRAARGPAAPSDEERKQRECTRVPSWSWRRRCVRGRMSNLPRSSAPAGAREVPEVALG
eukprot:4632641-Alexandrium_andersonii.AAC.1